MSILLKTFAGAALAALTIQNSAKAADVEPPIQKAPSTKQTSATYNWSEFYLGANFGWGWRSAFKWPDPGYYSNLGVSNLSPAPCCSTHDGPGFGVGFGYNRQYGWFVWGIDYEFQFMALDNGRNVTPRYFTTKGASTTTTNIYGMTTTSYGGLIGQTALNYDSTDGDSNRWYGIVRGRVGTAFDRLLVFATGGAAYRFSYDYTDPYVANSNGGLVYYNGYNKVHSWGWVIGGGAEYAITDNLSIKADYLHFDFGNVSYVDPIASIATNSVVVDSARRTVDTVRAGLNLKITIPALSALGGGSYGAGGTGY
jgi:outer membrane immunogenic protein